MPDESFPNPYSAPESSAAERARIQDGKFLRCVGCQKKSMRVFIAFLRHPQLAIVCPDCGTRHRLTFARSSQFRYHAVALPAIGLGVIAIVFALRDQTYRSLDFFVARIIRNFQWSPPRSLISFVEATVLIVLLLAPVLLAAYWAVRAQLRMIAQEGILQERKKKTPR
ncbi:MAG: hypothetical protein JNM43_24805 [Planctomycetaceae bacterium]|nr:hypothetical protein [Planctomycetaceae bacterium]